MNLYKVESLEHGEWKVLSAHSQLVDAERQLEIFLDRGYLVDNVRIILPDELPEG